MYQIKKDINLKSYNCLNFDDAVRFDSHSEYHYDDSNIGTISNNNKLEKLSCKSDRHFKDTSKKESYLKKLKGYVYRNVIDFIEIETKYMKNDKKYLNNLFNIQLFHEMCIFKPINIYLKRLNFKPNTLYFNSIDWRNKTDIATSIFFKRYRIICYKFIEYLLFSISLITYPNSSNLHPHNHREYLEQLFLKINQLIQPNEPLSCNPSF